MGYCRDCKHTDASWIDRLFIVLSWDTWRCLNDKHGASMNGVTGEREGPYCADENRKGQCADHERRRRWTKLIA